MKHRLLKEGLLLNLYQGEIYRVFHDGNIVIRPENKKSAQVLHARSLQLIAYVKCQYLFAYPTT